MGSDEEDSLRDPDEGPVPVVLSQPYLIAETEVTQGLYETVMGFNPSEEMCRPGGRPEQLQSVASVASQKAANVSCIVAC